MLKKALFLFVIASLPFAVCPQQVGSSDSNSDSDKLEKSAVELLQETAAEVEGLRLIENREVFGKVVVTP